MLSLFAHPSDSVLHLAFWVHVYVFEEFLLSCLYLGCHTSGGPLPQSLVQLFLLVEPIFHVACKHACLTMA